MHEDLDRIAGSPEHSQPEPGLPGARADADGAGRNALATLGVESARGVWISRLPFERMLAYAAALAEQSPDDLPLYGIPFAIKDNIDLADLPTTAACPAYAYQPKQSAFVVRQLIAAGAIPVGKTNLDQFATGLVGTRSPYGVCRNSFDPAYIAGGSSSSGGRGGDRSGQLCVRHRHRRLRPGAGGVQ